VLNEGILYCKALSKVVCPETRSFADTTSIGKGLLVLPGVLDPVTTISCNLAAFFRQNYIYYRSCCCFSIGKTNVKKTIVAPCLTLIL
jgi:hypothetical protein